jgi:hypothetical protein
LEQCERLFDRPLRPRRLHLIVPTECIAVHVTHVRQVALDQFDGVVEEFVEVVGRVCNLVRFPPEPLDVRLDSREESFLLLLRVRIVVPEESQIRIRFQWVGFSRDGIRIES